MFTLLLFSTTHNLHHTCNGQYENSTEVIFLLFLFPNWWIEHNHNTTQHNHNTTTTTTKITTTQQLIILITMNGYNYSVRPLSLHLFCWNLTQHHRPMPVVWSVSLKTVGCLCKDSIVMHTTVVIFFIESNTITTHQRQRHNN